MFVKQMPVNDRELSDSATLERSLPTEDVTNEQAMCFCPACSSRLLPHRCKLICERCGYFMSCADYY